MSVEPERFYTVKQTSDILSLSDRSIRDKCKDGDLICTDIGKGRNKIFRIKGEDILEFLK